MTKLLDKSQIIHIVSEVVVLFGLTFYFTQKHNKLMGFINDLNKKIEDQENIIQKHEQMILKLINIVDTIDNKYTSLNFERNNKKEPEYKSSNLKTIFEPMPSLIFDMNNKKEDTDKIVKVEELYENSNIEDTDIIDLDAEIAEELSELES